MKNKSPITAIIASHLPTIMSLFLVSCGNYQSTAPLTAGQQILEMDGYPTPSGKPALRVPSTMGVLTTSGTDTFGFNSVGEKLMQSGQIRRIQSINAISKSSRYGDISDVLSRRAQLINETQALGLDVILVCDQRTKSDDPISLVEGVTLGIVDVGLRRKQNTRLTVLCMDARTGYVYGVMGREEEGHTPQFALFQENIIGDPKRSHLVATTRREAIEQFPAFWRDIVRTYQNER